MFSSLKLIFTILLLTITSHIPGNASHDTGIVATVNSRIITSRDLHNRLNMMMVTSGRSMKNISPELRAQALEVLITEEVQLLLGEEFGIKIQEPTLSSAIRDIEQQNNMADGQLTNLLKSSGIPICVLEKHLKASIIWREYIRGRYGQLVQVSEHDVDRTVHEREASKKEARYLLSEIFIPQGAQSGEGKTQGISNKVHAQLKSGAPFTLLARQVSAAPSAARGGDIDWVASSKLPPQAISAIAATHKGSFTAPIKTHHGYHIFLVRDRLESGKNLPLRDLISLKQVFFPLPQDAFSFEIQEKIKSIKVIASQIRSVGMLDKLLAGKNVSIQNIEDLPIANFPQEMRSLIGNTQVGRATQPVISDGGALIFVVSSRHQVDPNKVDRDEIRAALTDAKLQNVAAHELRNRRALAHVTIKNF